MKSTKSTLMRQFNDKECLIYKRKTKLQSPESIQFDALLNSKIYLNEEKKDDEEKN